MKILAAPALAFTSLNALAQTDLKAYATRTVTRRAKLPAPSCRNLEGGRRQADGLYSGWYNGLAKKHFFHLSRGVRLEHEVIVHCKAIRTSGSSTRSPSS